jgi:hypothetical protein
MTCDGSFVCTGKACKKSCSSDNDCIPGYACAGDHTCVVHPITTIIYFDPALSGNISSTGTVIARLIQAGDQSDNSDSCGFASFQISDIPKGSVVTSATLAIFEIQAIGNPSGNLGHLQAQKVSYTSFDKKSAYNPSSSTVVEISPNDTAGAKSAAVTSMVADDVSRGAANSQFRFCFPKRSNLDGIADFVQIASANDKPSLTITYHP